VRAYRAILEASESSGFGVIVPELPGCISAGETRDDARRNAVEALHLHLQGLQDDGIPLPAPAPLDAPLPAWLTEGTPPWREAERLLVTPKP
jgi:predicted RNase H-like HicB family nuclease